MLKAKKNPYPLFTDCDDAIEALVSELLNDDVDALKLEIISLARQSQDEGFSEQYGEGLSDSQIQDLEEGLDAVHTIEQLDAFVDSAKSRKGLFTEAGVRLLPVRYGASNVRIEEDFECVHYTDLDLRFSDNVVQDLLGRATPSRILMTGSIIDFYVRGNGYMFAYPKHGPESKSFLREFNWQSQRQNMITIRASKCVVFYHEFDRDTQCIVPLSCIEDAVFSENPDVQYKKDKNLFSSREDFEAALRDAPLEARLSGDATEVIVRCNKCGRRTTRHKIDVFERSLEGRLGLGGAYTCKLCKGDLRGYVEDLPSYPLKVYPIQGRPYHVQVKFFSDLQDIAERAIGERYLEIFDRDLDRGIVRLHVAETVRTEGILNMTFSVFERLYGPVFEMSAEHFDKLEYEDPRDSN